MARNIGQNQGGILFSGWFATNLIWDIRCIILRSAGSVHSPHVSALIPLPDNVLSICLLQILMLSGVGPVEHLRSHKIPIVFEHPRIGQNLIDHPVVDLYFKDKRNSSVKWMRPRSFTDLVKFTSAMVQYFVLGSGGPLATNVSIDHPLDGLPSNQRKKFGESAAFIRSDDPKLFPSSEYPQHLTDSTSAADSPDLELFTTPFAYKV